MLFIIGGKEVSLPSPINRAIQKKVKDVQADSRKIISENIVADRSKLKIICVFLYRIYFGRIPYEGQYRGKSAKQ